MKSCGTVLTLQSIELEARCHFHSANQARATRWEELIPDLKDYVGNKSTSEDIS